MKIVNGYQIKPEADLHGAYLCGADLGGADLHRANLYGAYLHGAYLCGADLHGADLGGADLHEANLHGADLHGADLHGADLSGADNIVCIGPIGSRNDILYAVKHPKTIMFKTGCFWGNGPALLKAANQTHGVGTPITIQYRAAINLARVIFKQYDKLNEPPF